PAADGQLTDHARLGLRDAPGRGRAADHRVNLVLAHVLVGALAFVPEQGLVISRQARHDLVERTRHEQLPGTREAHDALRNVDAVADDVHLIVQVFYQPHRAEVHPQTHGDGARHVARPWRRTARP